MLTSYRGELKISLRTIIPIATGNKNHDAQVLSMFHGCTLLMQTHQQ